MSCVSTVPRAICKITLDSLSENHIPVSMVAKEIPRSYDHIFYHAFLRVMLFFAFAEQYPNPQLYCLVCCLIVWGVLFSIGFM